MEDFSYKTRTQGAVGSERMQLLSIIAHYWDELERYENEGGTQRQKWDMWETIASEFNNHPSVSVVRTPLQVKTLFKNMKTKAKKYKTKLEESQASGFAIETDLISETVLKLNKYQSRGALNEVLEPLNKLYYISRETHLPLPVLTKTENRGLLPEAPVLFEPPKMLVPADEIEANENGEEMLESKPSVTEGTSSFPSPNDVTLSSENSPPKENSKSSSSAGEPSQVHTFGDLSVTPISSEVQDLSFRSKLFSSTFRPSRSPIEVSPSESSLNIDNIRNSKKATRTNAIKRPFNTLENEIALERLSSSLNPPHQDDSNMNHSLGKCGSERQCCCPDYHKELLAIATTEHKIKVSLLNEEILCERAKRNLHEEERRSREQNLLFKQEEREDALAEHRARMKVIEMKCEAVEARIRSTQRTNKWILTNGSNEI